MNPSPKEPVQQMIIIAMFSENVYQTIYYPRLIQKTSSYNDSTLAQAGFNWTSIERKIQAELRDTFEEKYLFKKK